MLAACVRVCRYYKGGENNFLMDWGEGQEEKLRHSSSEEITDKCIITESYFGCKI